MPDTHLTPAVFERDLAIIKRFDISVEWKLFDVPWEVLRARNEARGFIDPSHRQPEAVLRLSYEVFQAPDAWWRSLPPEQIEIGRL